MRRTSPGHSTPPSTFRTTLVPPQCLLTLFNTPVPCIAPISGILPPRAISSPLARPGQFWDSSLVPPGWVPGPSPLNARHTSPVAFHHTTRDHRRHRIRMLFGAGLWGVRGAWAERNILMTTSVIICERRDQARRAEYILVLVCGITQGDDVIQRMRRRCALTPTKGQAPHMVRSFLSAACPATPVRVDTITSRSQRAARRSSSCQGCWTNTRGNRARRDRRPPRGSLPRSLCMCSYESTGRFDFWAATMYIGQNSETTHLPIDESGVRNVPHRPCEIPRCCWPLHRRVHSQHRHHNTTAAQQKDCRETPRATPHANVACIRNSHAMAFMLLPVSRPYQPHGGWMNRATQCTPSKRAKAEDVPRLRLHHVWLEHSRPAPRARAFRHSPTVAVASSHCCTVARTSFLVSGGTHCNVVAIYAFITANGRWAPLESPTDSRPPSCNQPH